MPTVTEPVYAVNATLPAWQLAWRNGFAPLLSATALTALAKALRLNDPALIQGATTEPPPLDCARALPVQGACALSYCGWQGEGLETVDQVEEFFVRSCYEADQRLGESAACRYFLNWFDETPRADMRRQLLAEIDDELARRNRKAA